MNTDSLSLARSVDFDLLGILMGKDLKTSLQKAIAKGVNFPAGRTPLAILHEAIAASVRDVEFHPRGKLFQDLLRIGPYEDSGEIPEAMKAERMSDADVSSAITFIYSYMVNSFKGALTELLATHPCLLLVQKLQSEGKIPRTARLYVGDSVLVHGPAERGLSKGADLHILVVGSQGCTAPGIVVVGVIEVKSYSKPASSVSDQVERHIERAKHGLRVNGVDYLVPELTIGAGRETHAIRITVMPSKWKLPRSFRFESSGASRLLVVDRYEATDRGDEVEQIGEDTWCITLKWSVEAIEEAAYGMTFWYMGKVGEVVYSESVPRGCEEMDPAEAGRNAVKMMLYYAILRARTRTEEQRAIALYNSYSFGYPLGMNFRDPSGRREMLWPQDLDKILLNGRTTNGCTIR